MSRNCTSGQDSPHRLLRTAPSRRRDSAPAGRLEVVDEQEAALVQVGAQPRGFAIGDRPPADLDDVGDRVLEQLGIVERDGVDLVDVRPEELTSFMICIRLRSASG